MYTQPHPPDTNKQINKYQQRRYNQQSQHTSGTACSDESWEVCIPDIHYNTAGTYGPLWIPTGTYTHVRTCTHTYTHVRTCTHTYTHVRTCTHIHTHTHTKRCFFFNTTTSTTVTSNCSLMPHQKHCTLR